MPKVNNHFHNMIHEAHLLKDLKHPNIPLIYDIEEDNENIYIIEEFIEGESLVSYVQNHKYIQEEIILNFSIQICEVIQYLHSNERKILYLDLKPEHIIISKDMVLKLIDFGASVYLEQLGNKEVSFGTRGYAAPEQYTGRGIGKGTDIYGIGMLMLYMVNGCVKYDNNLRMKNIELTSRCSKEVKKVINKSLAFNKLQRYKNIDDLLTILSNIYNRKTSRIAKKSTKSHVKKISVAGMQERIGSTHVALAIASALSQLSYGCIYIQSSGNNVVKSICNKNNIKYNTYVTKEGTNLLFDYRKKSEIEKIFDIQICDYGVISFEKWKEYNQGDIKILVVGSKEWEIDKECSVVKELIDECNINYFYNFGNHELFTRCLKSVNNTNCYRMPYIVNPFKAYSNEVFCEMLKDIIACAKRQ